MKQRKPFKAGEYVLANLPPEYLVAENELVKIISGCGNHLTISRYNAELLTAPAQHFKREREPFERGDDIVCHSSMSLRLTVGKTYKVIGDEMEGIFQSDPYVEVIDDLNQHLVCAAHRFHYPLPELSIEGLQS